jgi:hypothetical protein
MDQKLPDRFQDSVLERDFQRTLMSETAKLARSAERWGAGPQGAELANYARAMSELDFTGAMDYRDNIRRAFTDARWNRIVGCVTAGCFALMFVIPLTIWLSY